MPRKKAGKFRVQREKKRQKQIKLEGGPGGKKAKKRAKRQDLSARSPASREEPSGGFKTSLSQEHTFPSPQKPTTLAQNTTGRPVTNKVKVRVAKGVIKYLGKKDKPPRVRGKRSRTTLPGPPLPLNPKAYNSPIMSQGGDDTGHKRDDTIADRAVLALENNANVTSKPLNLESSSDEEDDLRLADLRSVAVDSQSILQTAAEAATNKRKARRGKGSTERSKLARHRIGGGSSDEEPELKYYQIRTQDLLFRHLDRTFGSKIGFGEEATERQEKKTEGEVDGVRGGGQGGGAEGGVDMDLEGWGGIRLFGKSVSAKRGRSEAVGGDEGEGKDERKKKRKRTKKSEVEVERSPSKDEAKDGKKREEVGGVEGALEKGCGPRKPKKKKGKDEVKEEAEKGEEEREVEVGGVVGKEEKKKAKKKKKKTKEEAEGECKEGVVGGEGDSLHLVLNKRRHGKGKGGQEVDGVGGAKEGVKESAKEGAKEGDIDKVCDSGKKTKLKAKAKRGSGGKEEEMR